MITPEGADEKPVAVASFCDREPDGGDDFSHYSSCGDESDFDRYCSAGSAMGTPSSRSNSFQDSDVWSLKSLKLGGESNNIFKNSGRKRVLSIGGASRENRFIVSDDAKVGIEDEHDENGGIDGGEDRDLWDSSKSGHEHSEGEDSMFGCGSDDGRTSGFYFGKNVDFRGGESRRDENRLVMNSAVAFGSDDWDDYVQGNGIGSIVWDKNSDGKETSMQSGVEASSLNAIDKVSCLDLNLEGQHNEVRNSPEVVFGSAERDMDTLLMRSAGPVKHEVSDMDELVEYLGYNPDYDMFRRSKNFANEELKIGGVESGMEETRKVMPVHYDAVLKNRDFPETVRESDPLSESVDSKHHLVTEKGKETAETKLVEDESSFASSSVNGATSNVASKIVFSFDQIEDHFAPDKPWNDFFDEIVDDMQDILLDSGESMGSRPGNRMHQPQFHQASRDGNSSASTSGTDYVYNSIHQPHKIDRIEVVGARQKKGDVSFSERLVGVQRYTVYVIRVWSGEDQWEVERRYRDFSALYLRLKRLFADHGWTLPPPWSAVERESRKLFANASPGVVADRSVLIQECLQSVIHPKYFSGSLNALIDFLSPSEGVLDTLASMTGAIQSPYPDKDSRTEEFSTLGKTISLIVQIPPPKSMKQMLDAQHYRCAGCHKNFDDGRTRVQEFVQALGWGKRRLCEYSGQLFCSSCHNYDYAVLPARVLHNWDFTRYPVSQLAKSFLDSISDKPMLCVSAVNPFLFSKVVMLQNVANIRSKIRAMMPYVRCPFRQSVYKGLGARKYLLDSNDFFALRDLIDLSKGVFSALPTMVEAVSRKIQEHITEQCLVCYDVGIPCSARKDCDNPLSLIFPFQEGEIEKCRSCKLVFHKNCFKKLDSCHCGVRFKQNLAKQTSSEGIHNTNSNSDQLALTVGESSDGLLAGLFSKVMPGRSQTLRKQESKGVDNIILMGSLPNISL